MSRLISLPTVEALRPSIRPILRMMVPLPISIRMTWRSSSDRCEHASPPHRCNIPSDWLSGQSPIQRVLHFQLDNGAPDISPRAAYNGGISI